MKKFKIISFILSFVLAVGCIGGLASCGETEHEHTFAAEWKHDTEKHWHEATCGHDVKDKEAAHTFVGDECSVCHYVRDHVHTYEQDWSKDAEGHWHKSTCGHADEAKVPHSGNPCSVCGYVEEQLVSHYFETEDPHLDACGGEYYRNDATSFTWLARFEEEDSDVGAPILYSFNLDAEKEGNVKVLMRIKTRAEAIPLSTKLSVMFNDEPVTVSSEVPVTTEENGGIVWVELFSGKLVKGQNTIDLAPTAHKSYFCIDKIDVQCVGEIGWYDDGQHYCEHCCPGCRGCLDMECTEGDCTRKGASASDIKKKNEGGKCAAASSSKGSNTAFEAEDARATHNGNVTVTPAANETTGYVAIAKGASITFNITQESKQHFCFRFSVSKLPQGGLFQDYFKLEVDGVDWNEYIGKRSSPIAALADGETAGVTFTTANLGCAWLEGGDHVVTLTALTDTPNLYIDSMFCAYRSPVTWKEAE